mmetsp:Transcript_15285/g.38606  ORF Transcript_15285/g.38606 Transcript_15285/m.38606 type:complete len:110 (+) Transcript_15285:3065-3394(+)
MYSNLGRFLSFRPFFGCISLGKWKEMQKFFLILGVQSSRTNAVSEIPSHIYKRLSQEEKISFSLESLTLSLLSLVVSQGKPNTSAPFPPSLVEKGKATTPQRGSALASF